MFLLAKNVPVFDWPLSLVVWICLVGEDLPHQHLIALFMSGHPSPSQVAKAILYCDLLTDHQQPNNQLLHKHHFKANLILSRCVTHTWNMTKTLRLSIFSPNKICQQTFYYNFFVISFYSLFFIKSDIYALQ